MTCTLVQSPSGTVLVHSPYNRDFAYAARQLAKVVGGDFNRALGVWELRASVTYVEKMCLRFYPNVVQADAIPVPVVPEALPDFGFFGTVGSTVTLDLEITKTVDCNGRYGASRLHVMKDATGHVFTWFASTARYEAGSAIRLEGKIKSHQTYNGTSQTILTRCKKV